ncbi:hypothetical protein K440DRAFT_45328 [Wilcoxina mikolae CBS 423.85]|nr:hypothetical protein K440DRAFT_45328 [Wilcoxina mikolae CBS 423.85]
MPALPQFAKQTASAYSTRRCGLISIITFILGAGLDHAREGRCLMQEQQMLVGTCAPILWLLGATNAARESQKRGFLWYILWNVRRLEHLCRTQTSYTAHLCVCTQTYSYRRLAIFLRNR